MLENSACLSVASGQLLPPSTNHIPHYRDDKSSVVALRGPGSARTPSLSGENKNPLTGVLVRNLLRVASEPKLTLERAVKRFFQRGPGHSPSGIVSSKQTHRKAQGYAVDNFSMENVTHGKAI
jgi:hypothetical protein